MRKGSGRKRLRIRVRKKKHKNLELGTKDGIHPLSIVYRVVLLGREECVTVRKRSLRGSRGKELFSFMWS